jgi:glycosyltransferase involved in cell wall biosynthesis
MKVAHLIDTLAWGGAQKLLVDFADEAVPRGLEVLVIVLRPKMNPSPYPLMLENAGAQVKTLSVQSLYDLSAIPQLLAVLREEKVDVLHTHLSHANVLGGIVGRLAGIPVVATLHNVWSLRTRTPSVRSISERLVLRFLTRKVVSVGNIVAESHQGFFSQSKMLTIPNPVNKTVALLSAERDKLRREIAGDSYQTIVLAIGRLLPRKGYSELISAFASVHTQHPHAILAVAGGGGMGEQYYQEQARSLGLNGNIRFLGYREDISTLLGASDLYVSSSHWEGLSVAMLEAMSAGIPVLATSVGEAPYLLAEGRGVLVPPHDTESFARQFSYLLEDAETRRALGEQGRAYVEKYHSVEAWVDTLQQLYTNLMDQSA